MKISILREVNHGNLRHVVAWTDSRGVRCREYHVTETDAQASAAGLRENVAKLGDAWRDLTARERADIVAVAHEIRAAGLTLRGVWDTYREAGQVAASITLRKAIDACVAEKRSLGRRPAYVDSLAYTLGLFASGRESVPVATISTAVCEGFLVKRKTPSVRASFQTRLSTLFSWCVTRGYAPSNPVDRIGRVSVEQRAPVILTPAQADAALAWARGRDIEAYFVIGLFCGIRPDELMRLRWESVDLARGLVTIDAATSKVRRRRIVPIAARARALLSAMPTVSAGPIWPHSPATVKRRRAEMIAATGIPQSADLLRHTCASYMMARDGDAGKVAGVLGNSPGVLLTRYRELVSPEAAAEFWGAAK